MQPYIIEYLNKKPYCALVIPVSCDSPLLYLNDIAKNLDGKSLIGVVLIDALLHSGNSRDRFYEVIFDGHNLKTVDVKNIQLARDDAYRKKTSEILRGFPDIVENSILNSIQKKLLMHGVNI